MKVKFVNKGYGTDDGFKEVEVVKTELSVFGWPQLIIKNPWWTGDTLVCQWENNELSLIHISEPTRPY